MKILVDGMNIAYRCHAIHDKKQGLSTPDGQPTGLMYGFLRTLVKWKKEYPQSSIHIAWDSSGAGEWRKEEFSEYKADRGSEESKKGKDEYDFYGQIDNLKENFLPSLGIEQFYSPGDEADDVIGTLCEEWSDDPVIIVSTDHDFLQLVDMNTVLVSPDMRKKYDVDKVEEEYGVPPKWILPFRALDGDSSDNLPGLSYFRKKIIAKLMGEFDGDLEELYQDELPDHLTDKESSKLEEFEDQAFTNHELMELQMIDNYEEIPVEPDNEKISSLCDEFKFKSIREDLLSFQDDEGFMKTN
jgi:DNA polymerase-1